MSRLKDKISYLEETLLYTRQDLNNHIHCKDCGKAIYGKTQGESDDGLERRNPLHKFRICMRCSIRITENHIIGNRLKKEKE